MKVSVKWLKTMVQVPDDLVALCNHLDLTGTAVEGLSVSGQALDGVVVGHIVNRDKHPDADRLWVTTVDVGTCNQNAAGEAEPLQIVCGAQNFVAGDKVPVAMIGSILPDGTVIKQAKMRGIKSQGMNCSARELGLGEDHDGLLILPADAPVGCSISQYLNLSDSIIELEITPNRTDCMSMLGVAREIAAVYQRPDYDFGRSVSQPVSAGSVFDEVLLSIDDPELCSRYTARVIKGITIGPSPDWLAERVRAAGARSINNIVDVTNYIMFETGQPLHAFDLNSLAKNSAGQVQIIVRAAAPGEHFTTLDGVERVLDSDITCIVDGNAVGGQGKTIALAGVMGGLESEVTEQTVDILLESAAFSPTHTSRTSRKLQLFSEASQRYERIVDDATCDDFSLRAAALMAEVGGGKVCEGVVDVYPSPRELPTLLLRRERLRKFIGATISDADCAAILRRLGCTVNEEGNDLVVIPPSFRPDLEREIDLYEEILRIWGMERVPSTLPGGSKRIGTRTLDQQRIVTIGAALRACGLNETMTYALTSAEDLDKLRMPLPAEQIPVQLINPMNSEQGHMRQSIIPGLLRSVASNQSHGTNNVQLYESGIVFNASRGRKLPKERAVIAAVLSGNWHDAGWNETADTIDFYDGKGIIEALARELNIAKLRFKPLAAADSPWLQPGRGAEIVAGSLSLGWLGELHPLALENFAVEGTVVAFELEQKALLSVAQQARDYQDIPLYPSVQLDIALLVDEQVSVEQVMQTLRSAGGSLLFGARLFDVFRDAEKLGAGRKSLAFALNYRANDRTLTSQEVEKLHEKILRKVCLATGGELRA